MYSYAKLKFENRNGKGCIYESRYEQQVHRSGLHFGIIIYANSKSTISILTTKKFLKLQFIWRKVCELGAKPVGVFVDENAETTPKLSEDADLQFVQRYLQSTTSCSHLGRTDIIPQHAFSSSTTNKSDAKKWKFQLKDEHAPILILYGFTGAAVILAVTSVTRQLIHHPGVQVNKSNRSMVPEVDSPELSHAYGDKFISKSDLRKAANILKRDDTVDTDRGDVYTTEGSKFPREQPFVPAAGRFRGEK